MARPKLERTVRVDYYRRVEHLNPTKSGYPATIYGAYKGAAVNLVLGYYEKAVAVRRSNERVLWTRIRVPGLAGGQIIVMSGQNTPDHLSEIEKEILGLMNRR